jgi:hypothetical protein
MEKKKNFAKLCESFAEEDFGLGNKKKICKTTVAPAAPVNAKEEKLLSVLPVKTLHEFALQNRDQSDIIFIRRLEETGRISDGQIYELPPLRDVLSFIKELPTKPYWYKQAQQDVQTAYGMKYPNLNVLPRDYIREFLRTPLRHEYACNNEACESLRCHGFRLRALIVEPKEGERVVPNNWCYLCHLYGTNMLYLQSKNRQKDQDKDYLYQIHSFSVKVDVPGEYKLEQTLLGEDNVRGLFGPFPLYSKFNYTPVDLPAIGCKGLVESDHMVFRPPQAMP